MAKDLPYFKFFCSEWNDGDITLETYEHQGLFINICSYYWSNECNVNFDKLLKRFRGYEELIDDLSAAELFKIKEDRFISISFLDEQRDERAVKSKVNSINGAKGGRPKKRKETENKPNALNSLTETKGNKIREEEKREEENILDFKKFTDWFNSRRTQYLEIPSNIKRLTFQEKTTLTLLKKDYTKDDFELAMYNMCNDQWTCENKQVLCSYFLRTEIFNKFLSTEKKPMLNKKQRINRGWKS